MHVGLNLVFLVPGETGGMEVYARELAPRLAALDGLRVTAFVNREAAGEDFGTEDQVVVPVDASSRVQWVRGEQMLLPGLAARAGCDIVHSLASTAPLRGAFRRVVTIHDLHYKTVPEAHGGLRAKAMGLLVPAAARRSHHVIAISEHTATDLGRHLGLGDEKVTVVPQGVSAPRLGSGTPEPELRARFGLANRRVVLTTGGTRPHKNVERLAEAVDGLDDVVLVVTGYPTSADAAHSARAHVARTGLVSHADLDGLYGLAELVAVPSLAEGFGLPVLEAMVRGVPVACSDRGALSEVAGAAAAMFDPHDVVAMRRVIARLLGDPEQRELLRAAGLERAATFSWETTARATAAVYARVARTGA